MERAYGSIERERLPTGSNLHTERIPIRRSVAEIEPLRIGVGSMDHRHTRYRRRTSDSTITAGCRMLSGNTRFGCLDRLGIVGVVVAHVISRALEFNKLGADMGPRDR